MKLTRRGWMERMFALMRSALVLPVSLLGASSAEGDPPARTRKFREGLGLGVKFAQGEPLTSLQNLAELRVRWVRDIVLWSVMEPVAGEFKPFPTDFQTRLDFYRANDIGIVFLLAFGNLRAYPPTPNEPNRFIAPSAFARYAVEVAKQLNAAGVRFLLEVWNEPHSFVLGPTLGGAWNGKPPSPWLDHYVRIVGETVRQVKAFDPAIEVMSDDDMWVLHYWFLEAGLPRKLDGFAFHPYVNDSCIGPEMTAVSADTDWTRPFTVVDADRSFRSAVRRLRGQGIAKLGKAPRLWITEWGWAIGQKTPFGPVTEDMLAGFLPRAFIAAEAAGVEALCWFSSQDSVDGPMGLVTNDGRKRKSYAAFKTLAEQLGDFELVSQIAGSKHPTSGVQAYLFRDGDRYRLALWNIEPANRLLVLPDVMRESTAIDSVGQAVPIFNNPSGVNSLLFSSAPIYISGVAPGPALDAALAAVEPGLRP